MQQTQKLKIIEMLLQNETRIDNKLKDGDSILIRAVKSGIYEIVDLIINKSPDINYIDKNGWTALMHSKKLDNKDISALLEKQGAQLSLEQITILDTHQKKLLFFKAIEEGNLYKLSELLKAGININDQNENTKWFDNALVMATKNNDYKTVEFLIENHADINVGDGLGRTGLTHASINGYVEIAKYLILNGANINNRDGLWEKEELNNTILDHAITHLQIEIVQLLLKNKVKVTNKSFFEAATSCSVAILNSLIEYKSNVNFQMKDESGDNLIGCALKNIGFDKIKEEDRIETIKLLVEHGIDINTGYVDNFTPLIIASRAGESKTVSFLIENGANIEASETRFGHNSLIHAVWQKHEATVRLLLDKGANINAEPGKFGTTAFNRAYMSKDLKMIRVLLEYGIVTTAAHQILNLAIVFPPVPGAKENSEVIQLLFSNLKGEQKEIALIQKEALIMAINKDNVEIVKVLMNSGINPNIMGEKDLKRFINKNKYSEIGNILINYSGIQPYCEPNETGG